MDNLADFIKKKVSELLGSSTEASILFVNISDYLIIEKVISLNNSKVFLFNEREEDKRKADSFEKYLIANKSKNNVEILQSRNFNRKFSVIIFGEYTSKELISTFSFYTNKRGINIGVILKDFPVLLDFKRIYQENNGVKWKSSSDIRIREGSLFIIERT